MIEDIGKAPIAPQDVPRGRPNCGVVALAHFTDQPYARVERFIGKRRSSRWRGVSNRLDYAAFFARIGLPVVRGRGKDHGEGETLLQWVNHHAQPGRRYMVITTGHAQVVYDGKVLDQHDGEMVPVERFHWKRKRVRSWYMVDGEEA